MTVIELINQLKDMPHNAQIYVEVNSDTFKLESNPEMVWNDHAENYLVVL